MDKVNLFDLPRVLGTKFALAFLSFVIVTAVTSLFDLDMRSCGDFLGLAGGYTRRGHL